MTAGSTVSLFTTGALPTGLTAGKGYFIINVTSEDTFQLSETESGSAIATSGTQSGTHKYAKWELFTLSLGTTTSAGFVDLELVVAKGDTTWNLRLDDMVITESEP